MLNITTMKMGMDIKLQGWKNLLFKGDQEKVEFFMTMVKNILEDIFKINPSQLPTSTQSLLPTKET